MKRIDNILEYVDENKYVADIGSDHGITAIRVYEEKSPIKVIATDISKPSLQKLIDKLEDLNYDIETLVTDGIKELSKDIDQIIISGMGGFLISQILEDGIEIAKSAEKLILQANNSIEHLRKWLHKNSFNIDIETMIEDEGYIYDIIVAKFTNEEISNYTDLEYKFGKQNIDKKSDVLKEYLKLEIDNMENIYNKIVGINTDKVRKKCLDLQNEKKELEKLVCKLEN